jgi:GH25 family lysozyme M1 (1,4-beta-N-acetylmuramidase)
MRIRLLFITSLLFIGCCANAQPLLGIDVSSYQGSINWTQVKASGKTFAWAKATEGLTVTDSYYHSNALNGVAAGVYMGAYHFAHPDVNSTNSGAIAEANHFLSVAGSDIISCELPPVLDYEVSNSLSGSQAAAWIQNWMNTVKAATGITPILYTDGSIANSLGNALVSYCKLWIADPDGSITAAPSTTYLGSWYPTWTFKQYSWTGSVSGISGNVDMDSFNGTLADLQNLMNCNSDHTAPTTIVNIPNTWKTQNFVSTFTDADNSGGSGLEKSYYQAIYYDGTQWGANHTHGFYADDFNTTLNPNWTTSTGTWSIVSNALNQSDASLNNTNIYAPLTQNLSNRYLYSFKASIGGTGTNRRGGIHIFCDQPDSTNRNNSYLIWFRVDLSEMDIYKVVNNNLGTAVYTTTATINANQSYNYIIIFDRISGLMRVYQDNVLIGSWTDSSPYSNGGYISFRSGNSNMSVDQLRVYRSRASSANISVGSGNTNDLEYQNINPSTPAAHINSICSDSAGNLSAFASQPVNVDWTKPTNLTAVNNSNGSTMDSVCGGSTQLSANWSTAVDANSGIAYYQYAIGTTAGAHNIVPWTNNGNNTSVTSTGLTFNLGQYYYVSVRAVDSAGLTCDSITGHGVLNILCSDGINQITGKGYQISIYPNPNKGDFIIKVNGTTKQLSADIYNSMGQLVRHEEGKNAETELHITNLSAGIYFINVFSEGIKINPEGKSYSTQKVIIQ